MAGPSRGTGWGFGGHLQVGENLDDHGEIFNGGDELQEAVTKVQTCMLKPV